MSDDEVKWHDGIEPLTRDGLEEVRRHPASYAELRLVATCDEMRRAANAEFKIKDDLIADALAACSDVGLLRHRVQKLEAALTAIAETSAHVYESRIAAEALES